MKTTSKQNLQADQIRWIFFFAANSSGKILKGDGRRRGGEIAPGACARGAASHASSPWPPSPSSRVLLPLPLLPVSLSLAPPHQREREGRPLPCFFGNRVAQESIKTPRSAHAHTRTLSLLSLFCFFSGGCFSFLTAPVCAAIFVQVG